MAHQPSEKSVLITGCSSGFGLLTAARLSSIGYNVYATMRDLTKQDALKSEVSRRGGVIKILELDVIKPETIHKALQEVKNDFGYLDVLINNAGYGIGGYFEDFDEEEIRQQMETNFFGVQNVTRQTIPLMRKRAGAKIINMSSISGFNASPGFSAYCASKWALEAFSESLRYELSLFDIDVLLVQPGAYKTDIFTSNAQYARRFNDPDSPYFDASQHLKNQIEDHLEDNHKNPEEVAELIEKLIVAKNPKFRNIPDLESRLFYYFRKFLPFRLVDTMIRRAYFKNLT